MHVQILKFFSNNRVLLAKSFFKYIIEGSHVSILLVLVEEPESEKEFDHFDGVGDGFHDVPPQPGDLEDAEIKETELRDSQSQKT